MISFSKATTQEPIIIRHLMSTAVTKHSKFNSRVSKIISKLFWHWGQIDIIQAEKIEKNFFGEVVQNDPTNAYFAFVFDVSTPKLIVLIIA